MAVQYILEKIKIDGALQDLLTKSSGEHVAVTYNGTNMTLNAALEAIGAGDGNVRSDVIGAIAVLDRADYDALAEKSPATLYLIRG